MRDSNTVFETNIGTIHWVIACDFCHSVTTNKEIKELHLILYLVNEWDIKTNTFK